MKSPRRVRANEPVAPLGDSAKLLKESGIQFSFRSFGEHLVVEGPKDRIDFWPGIGKWVCRSGRKGFGVEHLVNYCKENICTTE